MTYAPAEPLTALPYATPSAANGSPVAAGVWVCLAGLALVFFGGCFCIGILLLTTQAFNAGLNGAAPPQRMTWEQDVLMVALYGCALACLASGAYVVYLGLRKLLAIGR